MTDREGLTVSVKSGEGPRQQEPRRFLQCWRKSQETAGQDMVVGPGAGPGCGRPRRHGKDLRGVYSVTGSP